MVVKAVGLVLRAMEFLWTLLVMALVGNMIAQAFHGGNPASVNYAMFTSAFSMVSLFLLVPMTWKPEWGLHAIVPIVLDALNAVFFFTSGIVLAARLGAHSCSNRSYLLHNGVTQNSHHREKRCREGQASTAFLWFAWACYMGSLVLSLLAARSTGANLRSRGSRRGPAMSQV
ncbi:non-classical export protein Nce102, putative [Paecilomyces variotii No. 5]|uniref:Non-classical export protein Nce102, putative n=1 Tax=Byssochlamys spectabilis (strain No. 5 / NBRC 109023) TaxID=1356009 RepID=V5FGW7_BYSSN|nr:non-classical export protein Nce102, putative [Paecilomyces variotii No. 5]